MRDCRKTHRAGTKATEAILKISLTNNPESCMVFDMNGQASIRMQRNKHIRLVLAWPLLQDPDVSTTASGELAQKPLGLVQGAFFFGCE